MLVQQAVVTEADEALLRLKPVEEGCHACATTQCGIAGLSKLFNKSDRLLTVNNPGGFKDGEIIELLLDEKFYMHSVFFQYLWPLLVMLGAILLVTSMTTMFALHLVAAAVGLLSGFRSVDPISRWLGQTGENYFYIRKLTPVRHAVLQSVEVIS